MNVTYPTALVLQAIAGGSHHGFQIMDVTGLPSGSVYPILRRLEQEGLVRARWERHEIAQREGRPPRRYYDIEAEGEAWLAGARARFRALEAAVARPRPPRAGVEGDKRLKPARTGS